MPGTRKAAWFGVSLPWLGPSPDPSGAPERLHPIMASPTANSARTDWNSLRIKASCPLSTRERRETTTDDTDDTDRRREKTARQPCFLCWLRVAVIRVLRVFRASLPAFLASR